MRVLVITACTASKQEGSHPAGELYTGAQHQYVMRGARRVAAEVWIVSAGYGLVPADRVISNYDTTFQGLNALRAASAGAKLGIGKDLRTLLATPYDLAVVALGQAYLNAALFYAVKAFGGPTIALVAAEASKLLSPSPRLKVVPIGTHHLKRFGAGKVAVKGRVVEQICKFLEVGGTVRELMLSPDLLTLVEGA